MIALSIFRFGKFQENALFEVLIVYDNLEPWHTVQYLTQLRWILNYFGMSHIHTLKLVAGARQWAVEDTSNKIQKKRKKPELHARDSICYIYQLGISKVFYDAMLPGGV